MSLTRLPPAGNPIVTRTRDLSDQQLGELLQGRVSLYGSGTQALAAALLACRQRHNTPGEPQVVLPGYGCPDLVSAAVYAGCQPVLVDLEARRPWLDLSVLEQQLNENTIAIVAVNFLGISERLQQLKAMAEQRSICLIEDSAQAMPGGLTQAERGDYVIYSFGRGKPVSLLGGGAVLSFSEQAQSLLPAAPAQPAGGGSRLQQGLKLFAYNRLLAPWAYGLVSRLPFLGLGQTRFKPLQGLSSMPDFGRSLIASNVEAYHRRGKQVQAAYRQCVSKLPAAGITDLAQACGHDFDRRLLRYPLLLGSQELRDRLWATLDRAGLGSSKMYDNTLNNIPVAADYVREGPETVNAGEFSRRLLTLPVHAGVTQQHAEAICKVLSKELI